MALTLSTPAKNAANDAITALVDAGSANPQGAMLIKTAGAALLVTLDFDAAPAFAPSAAGQAVLNNTPKTGTAVAAGTAALFDVVDLDGVVIYSGTVGLSGSGADAIIDSVNIQVSDTVQLNSHTITAP